MARIAGIDLPKNKRGEIGLTYIFSIGRSKSRKILAVAGVDGTLKERLKTPTVLGKIQAKTGTMSGVTSLSGFVDADSKQKIIFSFWRSRFCKR